MRNVESRFATNPVSLDMPRSTFNRNSSVKTTFNFGEVIPFYFDEVLPGDTFNIKTSKLVRLQTMTTPVMDNMYLDTYYFFVPNRLVWSHWQEFMGENTQSPWIPSTEYQIPTVSAPVVNDVNDAENDGWHSGSLADYFGIPTEVGNFSVTALPFRAYGLIIDQWFRSENLQQPVNVPIDDTNITGNNGTDYVTDLVKGGKPFVAGKLFDYFVSSLPSPQKGPSVVIPGLTNDTYPITTGKTHDGNKYPLTWSYGSPVNNTVTNLTMPTPNTPYNYEKSTWSYGLSTGSDNNVGDIVNHTGLFSTFDTLGQWSSEVSKYPIAPDNLWVDLTTPAVTINDLRLAFQLQKYYERLSLGGSRYIEIIKSFFGVESPDSRLQRTEYLGGNRITLNVNQVIQSSASVEGATPQGNQAAYSLSVDSHNDFTRSFTEHGMVIGVMVARYDHSYQQGLAKYWSKRDKFDFYLPVFANIGEQSVKNKEIYLQGSTVPLTPGGTDIADDAVFGYQEAWAEYRYKPSIVTGEMRSNYATSLDSWHLGDEYSSLPVLSDSWLRENKSNVDRCLAVTSSVSNQLFADIYVQNKTTRPMPMYSVPGLIDHH